MQVLAGVGMTLLMPCFFGNTILLGYIKDIDPFRHYTSNGGV